MMKASFRLFFATLAATAALVACTKETTPPDFENDKVNPEGSRVIAVSFASQTKTTLDGFQPRFVDKDSILISNGEALDTCAVDVNGDNATISTNLTGPLTAVYPYKAAGMSEDNENEIDTVLVSTEQSGKFADANICMAVMKDEEDESLSFDNKTAVFCIYPPTDNPEYVEVSAEGFEIANDIPAGSTHTSLETIHVSTTTADSVWVSILVPGGLKVSDLTFFDGTKEKSATPGAPADKEIAAGTLYTVNKEGWESPEADIPDGALTGVFTVGNGADGIAGTDDDVKVYFSKGNLYWDSDSFEFETNQYDTQSSWNASHVSHFFWSKTESVAYAETYNDVSKAGSDVLFTNAETETAKSDFTVNGVTGKYRTLSIEEWRYLLNSGDYANGVRENKYKHGVTVCGKTKCLILVPDECLNGYSFDSAKTNYTADDWATAEAAGLVCLPPAGHREGSDFSNVTYCYYWSSTAKGSSDAYHLYCTSNGYINLNGGDDRKYGSSVRLVTDVSAAPAQAAPEYVEITMTVGGQEKTYKWAKCNLGAETETGYGDYYFWGTTVEAYTDVDYAKTTGAFTFKSDNPYGDIYKNNWTSASGFAWRNTPFTNGVYSGKNKKVFTKYVPEDKKSSHGYKDFYDNKTVLEPEDDVANKVLGGTWRMPTKAEFGALCNLSKEWKTNYNNSGVDGYLFTDKNNHSIFLPAAGCGHGTDLDNLGNNGDYWSSSLLTDNPSVAYCLSFNVGNADAGNLYRYYGLSVRPVSE